MPRILSRAIKADFLEKGPRHWYLKTQAPQILVKVSQGLETAG